MQKHTKIYMNGMGYDLSDFIPCEITGQKAIDIHHIIGRGKGGEDRIENLMAVTREVHIEKGDKVKYMVELLEKHRLFLEVYGVHFDSSWFEEKIRYYEARN